MASSLLTADKRWAAPTRKSGMTVLGKIPKPINLPSQRLENQGLDPNVEIVPKGTLTWGSKPGPTTPNAWNSSSLLSPKKDGNSGAPSQFNGRPSSGGGSRPSTAGSESLDSPNAWGPNSRPSSASGTVPSQHVPAVTSRPRSAETRPPSSHLSRFADNPENMNVSTRTVDRSGSSHGHVFTLSTGDFPTLGSEKISESNSQRGHSSKGRPTSSSGKDGAQNDMGKSLPAGSDEIVPPPNHQPADIMRTDQNAHDGSAPFPATAPPNEAQHPQPYPPNYCMSPPQFDSWRAPPGHPPEGMWHRGPGGPYRPVGPSSSFPAEPFPYYGQFPPNSEAAARQVSGHGGYHSKNADAYHSMPPNSYVMNQPVIPVRPVYQGPIPFDGYYGPQRANFNNAKVRDSPFTGGPHQPGILNQFPNQNEKFQAGHSQSRPVKHDAGPKELLESDRVRLVCRGQTRILHDNPDRLVGPGEVERKTRPSPPLLPHPDGNRNDVHMRADTRNTSGERNMVLMKSAHDNRVPDCSSHSSVLENAHSHPRETDDGTLSKKLNDNLPLDKQCIAKKNMMEKIESLNNKARNVEARNVAETFSNKEMKEKQLNHADTMADRVIKDVSSTPANTGFASAACGQAAACVSPHSPVMQKLQKEPNDGGVVAPLHTNFAEATKAGKLGVSTHDRTRRRVDSSRNNHHGPAKDMPPNNSAGHGQGEQITTESSSVVQLRNSQHDQPPEHVSHLPPVTPTDDMLASPDYESQRVKMRELAVQRAKQLKAEEEERTKRQKAKALAKLEELNKRSSVHQNTSDPPPENEDVRNKQKAGFDGTTEPVALSAESHDATSLDSVSSLQQPNKPKDTAVPAQPMCTVLHDAGTSKDPAGHNTSSSGINTQNNMMEHIAHKSISQSHDVGVPKPRQGNRKRHVVSEDKTSGEKSSVAVSAENVKKAVEFSLDTSTAVVTSHDDPPPHNKKSARNSRNKKKVDDAPATSKYPPMVPSQQNSSSISSEPKIKTAGVIISSSILPTENTVLTVGSITVGGISFGSFNQERLKLPEEAQGTANSRPRPQQAKGSRKIQNTVRPVEKPHGNESVVWAPVKPSGWNELCEEADTAVAVRSKPIGKCANDGDNITRTKRAEMERYVPKPLSKELQQQNSEQNLPVEKSSVENKSNDNEKLTAKLDAATEPKKWEDKKTSRGHGKSHSSWRRRNTDESASVVPKPSDRADSYQESHEVQRPSDKYQQFEPDKRADYAAGNSLAPTEALKLPVSAAKEHAAANRHKRQHVKGPKNEASNYSNENRDGRKDVHHMSTRGTDMNSSENRSMSRTEAKSSTAGTHSRAHWKPKYSHSQNNSEGNNTTEGQVDSATLQDSSNCNFAGNSNQAKGDMKHVDDNQKSESHENAEQQQFNHATRRQGQHNGRYQRGSGTHRGRGYDAGQASHGANADRQRGSTHLEYQPVGSNNKPSDFQQNPNADEQSVGPPAPGPVYRERGHNRGQRPPGGHFVKRNPAPAPAPNSYREE